MMKTKLLCTGLALALACSASFAQEKSSFPTVELSASASQMAKNDLVRVRAYVEQTGENTAKLAQEVNAQMTQMLALVKPYAAVKTRGSSTNTFPMYSKDSSKISAWRMRSELLLESADLAAMSELIGKLQAIAAVDELSFSASPETQKRVSDQVMVEAIKAFQAKAAVAAQALGSKNYRLGKVSIDSSNNMPRPVYSTAPKSSMSSSPAPIEPGESAITVNVRGSVELMN